MDETNGTTPHEDPRDDETTERPAADEDATRVLRGDEAGTRIWSGGDATETRVMPAGAAGAGAPPPPPAAQPQPQPQPTLIMSRPTHRSPGSVWWIVLLLVLAVLAVAAVWYFWLRGGQEAAPAPSPSPTPVASAGAWARTDGLGGGLIIEGGGETYQATAYDGALQPTDTVTAVTAADGTELRFTLPASSFGGPAGPLEATLTIGNDPDTASLRLAGAEGTTLAMPLRRVPSLTPAVPTASPTPTPSPTPTTTTSPSPSPSQEALRQQMIAAIGSVQAGIEAWATANGGTYPMPADVREGGAVAQYVDPWPVDPWAPAQFLAPGVEPGGYSYEQLEGGLSYTLKGFLDNGSYVVP